MRLSIITIVVGYATSVLSFAVVHERSIVPCSRVIVSEESFATKSEISEALTDTH